MGGYEMDSIALDYFMSLANNLNFTKSANECHITQSTMSKRIAALEDELGVKLFYRDSHSVRLTPAGMRLKTNALRYANQYRAINTSVHKLMKEYVDMLKIGCGLYEVHIMTDVIRRFIKECSDVELNYLQYGYSSMVSYISTNIVDIAIVLDTCLDSVEKKLARQLLYEDIWVVAAHKDSQFWRMSARDRAELRDQVIITMVNNEFEPIRPFCAERDIKDVMFTYTNSFEPTITMLQADAGITLLPQSLRKYVSEDIRMENVFSVPMKKSFYAVYNPQSDNNSLPLFLDFCKDMFNENTPSPANTKQGIGCSFE